jgi:hypothetical protein
MDARGREGTSGEGLTGALCTEFTLVFISSSFTSSTLIIFQYLLPSILSV